LGALTDRRNDARTMLQVGKPALGRGLALDHFAFPTIGIPKHTQIAPEIERSVIYSVARTESAFDQRDKSAANAVGLMQVTPEATPPSVSASAMIGTKWSPIPSTTRRWAPVNSARCSRNTRAPTS